MPIITALEVQKRNKNRINVYIDGEFYCAMEALSAVKFGIKTGAEVDTNKLQQTIFDSEVSVAFNKCIDYLARGLKTVARMRQYLNGKGYSPQVVDAVVDKLLYYKYLDDERYATMYVEQHSRTKGARRLKQELLQKGITKSQAEEHCGDREEDNADNIQRLADKYMRNKLADLQTLVKLQRYLLSRGYNYDEVASVINLYKGEGQW